MTIDLNCDVGESFGIYKIGRDDEVLPHVSSANVACGLHAGDPNVMMKTVELCKDLGVSIGAHPGLPDLAGFGRREIKMSPAEIYNLVIFQVGALLGITKARQVPLKHVKPHGALYHMAALQPELAMALAQAVKDIDDHLILVGLAGSKLCQVGRQIGLSVAQEAFADRHYEPSGQLTPRSEPGAVIDDANLAAQRVIRMIKENKVTTRQGMDIPLQADTICIHGDHPQALSFVTALRTKLQQENIQVQPLRRN